MKSKHIPVPNKERHIEFTLDESFFAVYFRGRSRQPNKEIFTTHTNTGGLLPCGWYLSQHDFALDWDGNVVVVRHRYDVGGKLPCGIPLPMKLRDFMERINTERVRWLAERVDKYDEPKWFSYYGGEPVRPL